VTRVTGGVQLKGWAIDPDYGGGIHVDVYSSNGHGLRGMADVSRSDIARIYPNYGGVHGFSIFFDTTSGAQNFCANGINVNTTGTVQSGGNKQLGCISV
jgi:hypothetical protein